MTNDLCSGLNSRFSNVVSSTLEHDFYLNSYYYFDYIYQNPDLLQLYQNASNVYAKRFADIWDDYGEKRRAYLESGRTIESPAITTQPREVARLEKFDMYCNAAGLDLRVYHPIKHYKECDCPHLCYDYNGSLLINGLDLTLKRYKDDYRKPKKDIIHTYRNWYQGKRNMYQEELSRFHIEFIEQVKQLSSVEIPASPILKPFLNLGTGDFLYFGKTGNFPVSGQEYKVLSTLLNAVDYKASYDQLVASYSPVTKAQKVHKSGLHTIIRNIKKRLGVLPKGPDSKPNPFVSVRRYGYRLEIPRG